MNPTCQSYNAQLCQVASKGLHTAAVHASLPFTGLDIGLLICLGVILILAGMFVRRYAR